MTFKMMTKSVTILKNRIIIRIIHRNFKIIINIKITREKIYIRTVMAIIVSFADKEFLGREGLNFELVKLPILADEVMLDQFPAGVSWYNAVLNTSRGSSHTI